MRKPKDDGSSYTADEVIKIVVGNIAKYSSNVTVLNTGYTIRAGEEMVIGSITIPENVTYDHDVLVKQLERTDVDIKYESLYGDSFRVQQRPPKE